MRMMLVSMSVARRGNVSWRGRWMVQLAVVTGAIRLADGRDPAGAIAQPPGGGCARGRPPSATQIHSQRSELFSQGGAHVG